VIAPLTATLELEPIDAVLSAVSVTSALPNAPVAPPRSDRLASGGRRRRDGQFLRSRHFGGF